MKLFGVKQSINSAESESERLPISKISLQLESCNSVSELEELISIFIHSTYDHEDDEYVKFIRKQHHSSLELPGLRRFFKDHELQIRNLLPFLKSKACHCSAAIQNLKYLAAGSNDILRLSRSDVCTLLIHMLLGTIEVQNGLHKYACTMQSWYESSSNIPQIYLKCFLSYLEWISSLSESHGQETIAYQRIVVDNEINWTNSTKQICELNYHHSTTIEQLPEGSTFEVDFANKDVGIGCCATQEEILFGYCAIMQSNFCTRPELCVAMLICETLQDQESLHIHRARKIGVTHGYGFDLLLDNTNGALTDTMGDQRHVIAIDAFNFHDLPRADIKVQLEDKYLFRELLKAYAGFSVAKNRIISTGRWGCGAFGGDPILKMIIQLIAASQSEVTAVNFCDFQEDINMKLTVDTINRFRNKLTVGSLISLLLSFRESLSDSASTLDCDSFANYIESHAA